MRRFDFKIPIYDWDITIITIFDKNDASPVKEVFNEFEIEDAFEMLKWCKQNNYI